MGRDYTNRTDEPGGHEGDRLCGRGEDASDWAARQAELERKRAAEAAYSREAQTALLRRMQERRARRKG